MDLTIASLTANAYRLNKKDGQITTTYDLSEEVKKIAKQSETTQSRICLHEDDNAELQIMIIYHSTEHQARKHAHIDKDEFIITLEGEMEISFFDGDGNQTKTIVVGVEKNTTCFIPKGSLHAVRILKNAVFIECTTGPFDKLGTIYLK